jgi:lipid A 3-O-deacylase
MRWLKLIYIFLCWAVILIPGFVRAQAIDNTVGYRNIPGDRYFRIFYENDFFSGTDRDYTQGIYIEKVHPALRKNPFVNILWHPACDDIKYGLAVEHDAYTPNLIYLPAIQYGDRPFAAALFLKTFLTASSYQRADRITTSLSTGIIGPGAGGEQMQRAIHHWIHYTQPQGWHNQISNDLVLNYQVNYEKQLISCDGWLSLSTYNSVRLGTLSDKLTTGFELMLGKFHSPFTANTSGHRAKFQWYFYEQPMINLVGYDATMQGGLFNHTSPYTIPSSDIERLVFQHRAGLVLILNRIYLEYYQTGNTIEFTTSVYHRTGGLQIGFGF